MLVDFEDKGYKNFRIHQFWEMVLLVNFVETTYFILGQAFDSIRMQCQVAPARNVGQIECDVNTQLQIIQLSRSDQGGNIDKIQKYWSKELGSYSFPYPLTFSWRKLRRLLRLLLCINKLYLSNTKAEIKKHLEVTSVPKFFYVVDFKMLIFKSGRKYSFASEARIIFSNKNTSGSS